MHILLDCRQLQQAGAGSERTRFIFALVKGLKDRYGVAWTFLVDTKKGELVLPEGARRVERGSLPGGIGSRLWYGWQLPRVVGHYKADLVMTMGGRMAGRIKTPSCSWEFSKKGPELLYSGTRTLVTMVPEEGIGVFLPEERERVKGEIAAGKEYFFADIGGVEASEALNLLKAFSLFKKRQLSNMKLVLAGSGYIENLDSYKYREDVCLYPRAGKELLGGAYAMVSLPSREALGMGVVNAWKAGVPVIGFDEREGILRVGAGDPGVLADGLKTLYKDEGFRSELIGKGGLLAGGPGWKEMVDMIWGILGKDGK